MKLKTSISRAGLCLAATFIIGCSSCSGGQPPAPAAPDGSQSAGATPAKVTPPAALTPAPSSSAAAQAGAGLPAVVSLPQGAPGIGFDDLRFSAELGKVLVPAGRSGNVDLVDPATGAVTAIGGFSTDASFGGGHDFGVTSVDQVQQKLYATDRTSGKLDVVDLGSRSIVASAKLSAGPDYVRWVAPTGELWVTEPDADMIEIFTLPKGGSGAPEHAAFIKTPGGPESLVVDATRGKAYAHLWKGRTIAIDLKSRAVTDTWPNGCDGSRGIALDEPRGWLFAGCSEGKAVVLDVAHGGKQLSSATSGSGVDIIDYSPSLGHLYLPGAKSATMAILGVSDKGELSVLSTVPTTQGAHCAVADAGGHVFVCDPSHGQLLVVSDGLPASTAHR
jgi:hypothetical protein